MERTFVMIKPDGVARGLIGEIIRRFEMRGFNIVTMKMFSPTLDLLERHYAVHKGQPFFDRLVKSISSGPVVAMVIESDHAITLVRHMMGDKDPVNAQPGTIRGDLTTHLTQNLIHGSDGPESADYEISLWFPELASQASGDES